ncbi:hypothetical protein [Actinomadura madurae]|uniref:hypothetical protein n=1 Tax=Actinomadura madurae TaxID=1993 RepID=UPI0020D203E9|nr:hypothetical protein [Actinomadura madurae]MCP9949882.1 hypothetical protein [Actinomadura madurae]MCP9979123.1 hypothetical protein [Actinomadura madurae]
MTDWHEIIGSVPRRSFTPDVVWADLGPGPWVRIDRTTDPAKWDEVVALDQPLVTQFEDGRTEGEGLASSSLSMPTMVVEFLDQLDPFDDHRVLDIGTGAGWTAALLSARVGAHNVTTVEVDRGSRPRPPNGSRRPATNHASSSVTARTEGPRAPPTTESMRRARYRACLTHG